MAIVRTCAADGGRAVPARHGYRGHMPDRKETLEVAGRPVVITNPDKVFFPASGVTKLDMVRYYLSVADGALRGVAGWPLGLSKVRDTPPDMAAFRNGANAPDPPRWTVRVLS